MNTYRRYNGGRGWQVLDDGRIVADAPATPAARLDSLPIEGGGYLYRTKGQPLSMHQLWSDYEPIIREASSRFGVRAIHIMALIGIEAGRLPGDRLRFDPRSVREEPGYRDDRRTPNKVSPGLMQTLLSTADQMNRKCLLFDSGADLTREDLFVPRYSILLGTAYVRHQIDRFESDEEANDLPADDPIANMVAAYNAGSVRGTSGNDWHLVTYSDHRIDRFIAWANDAHEVLNG